MTTFAHYFRAYGRIARGTWLFRLVVLSVTALAFGMLAQTLAGSTGAALVAIAYLWGSGAVCAQRLHDTGKSGWSLLWVILPIVGPLVVLFWLLGGSVDGTNRYGRDPRSRLGYLQVDIAR